MFWGGTVPALKDVCDEDGDLSRLPLAVEKIPLLCGETSVSGSAWGSKQVAMLGAALVLGMLVSFQWSAGAAHRPASPDRVEWTMHQLELEQAELKRQVARLRGSLDVLQQEAVADTELLEGLRAELYLEKAHSGLVDVRGPGVRVALDDSSRTFASNPSDLLIHDFDLRDVANVLWLAGAEAVAVNGERIVHSSSVYCVGSTVIVNDTRLSPPYVVSAIGDPMRMQDYLRNPGYLSELKGRCERFGLLLEFMRVETMTVPAYQGSTLLRFARPGSRGE
jgi:uncharacterized protein YlxW (UPF0749 family)